MFNEVYLHIHNARTLLGILLRYVEDEEYDDIYFAVSKVFDELKEAEECATNCKPKG